MLSAKGPTPNSIPIKPPPVAACQDNRSGIWLVCLTYPLIGTRCPVVR